MEDGAAAGFNAIHTFATGFRFGIHSAPATARAARGRNGNNDCGNRNKQKPKTNK
jgi:hypothetical protein